MTEQTKAQRLAERHEHFVRKTVGIKSAIVGRDMLMEAAAELRRLDALVDELVAALRKLLVFYGGPWSDEADFAAIEAKELLAKAKEQT